VVPFSEGGGANAHNPTRRWHKGHWRRVDSCFPLDAHNGIRKVNGVLGTTIGDMGGRWKITEAERDREGAGRNDGFKEFSLDSEIRRGSGGTSTHPKRDVSMAVSESSGGSVEPDMKTSLSSRPGSLSSAGGGSVKDETMAQSELN